MYERDYQDAARQMGMVDTWESAPIAVHERS